MALEASVTHIADLNKAWPVGADPKSSMDEHLRNLKTALLNDFPGFTGTVAVTGTDGGAANAYTLTPATALPGYSNRMLAVFAPTVANTGASTLNVSGLGVKPIVSVSGAALVSGDLAVGTIYLAAYDGTSFRLTSTTKNYADQLAFTSSLPAQAGNAGKYVTTDGTAASWASIVPPQVIRSARTANAVLGIADNQKFIDITGGTFSQTFDASATLGNGWYCWLRNSGTGDITLDPNAAELIDGLTSYVMYPGEARLIQCNGVTLTSMMVSPFSKTFTASGSFIKPPGYNYFDGLLWAGGGSGAKNATATGGAGGACVPFTIPASLLAASTAVTIGAGAAAVTAASTAGNTGGNSTFGSLVTSYGGGGGAATANANRTNTGGGAHRAGTNGEVGGNGGATGSDLGLGISGAAGPGTKDSEWGGAASHNTGAAGKSIFGGAAGGGHDGITVYVGGISKFGGNGGDASLAGTPTAGAAPGGGGGATNTGASTGPGARGELRIWGIA